MTYDLETGLARVMGEPRWESGLRRGSAEEFLIDLTLKTLYVQGARTGRQLCEAIRLPFPFLDDQLLALDEALDRLEKTDARAAQAPAASRLVNLTIPIAPRHETV